MKLTNIRITKISGDTELLESEYMPLILATAEKMLTPIIEEVLKDAA